MGGYDLATCKPCTPPLHAGFKVQISSRGYFPSCDDEELKMVLFRSQEIRCSILVAGMEGLVAALHWQGSPEAGILGPAIMQCT